MSGLHLRCGRAWCRARPRGAYATTRAQPIPLRNRDLRGHSVRCGAQRASADASRSAPGVRPLPHPHTRGGRLCCGHRDWARQPRPRATWRRRAPTSWAARRRQAAEPRVEPSWQAVKPRSMSRVMLTAGTPAVQPLPSLVLQVHNPVVLGSLSNGSLDRARDSGRTRSRPRRNGACDETEYP